MKKIIVKILLILPLLFHIQGIQAQIPKLTQVKIDHNGHVIECKIDIELYNEPISVIINGSGTIIRLEKRLETNNLKSDYYSIYEDVQQRRRLSQIGNFKIDYYRDSEIGKKRGEISRVGNVVVDYFEAIMEKEGRVYRIGDLKFDYYTSYSVQILSGKISEIGNIEFDYFANYIDTDRLGKVSHIGKVTIDYFTISDGEEKNGKISKVSGNQVGFDIIICY